MYKKYIRTEILEMRPVTQIMVDAGEEALLADNICMTVDDIDNGSPKIGDMIARNNGITDYEWLISAEFFKENFKEIDVQTDYNQAVIDYEFDRNLMNFIKGTRYRNGVVTEKEVREFLSTLQPGEWETPLYF